MDKLSAKFYIFEKLSKVIPLVTREIDANLNYFEIGFKEYAKRVDYNFK